MNTSTISKSTVSQKTVTTKQKLIDGLQVIPQNWVLTPVGANKNPYRYEWQNEDPIPRDKLINDSRCKGYGLRNGIISGGILSIDIDGVSAEKYLKDNYPDLPHTIAWTSGKEGRRKLVYVVPEKYQSKIKTKKVITDKKTNEQLELRWNGSQDVLPPSHHPDTGNYYWINSPQDTPVAECPQFIIDILLEDNCNSSNYQAKRINNYNSSDIQTARNIVESGALDALVDSYDEWTKIGMILQSIDDSLLIDWDILSSRSAKYKPGECEKKWQSFNKSGGYTIASLIKIAKDNGWKNTHHYAKNPHEQKLELPDEYEVTTTIEDSIYKIIFDEGRKNWFTENGEFFKYNHNKGCWEKSTEEKILKLIAQSIRKFYKKDKKGEIQYSFLRSSNIESSFKTARYLLALTKVLNNEHLIPFSNGTYNINSKQLEQHNPDNHITWGIDAEYKQQGDCPQVFRDFIVSSFGEEYIELIRSIISMYLDPSAPYGYFIHIIGKSGSGKGTFIKLLTSLFQQSCVTSINHFSELQTPEKRHQLLSGIRMCIAPDVNQYQGNISAFYELVDNGWYSGRPLYSSAAYNKQWFCRFLLASTQLLGIENAAEGWNRRCIPLQTKERLGEPDLNLSKKLQDAKADIISWALGIDPEQRDKILQNAHKSESIKQLKAKQETFADSIKAFIDSCTNYDINAEPLYDAELFNYYKEFCKYSGLKAKGLNLFRNGMNEVLGKLKVPSKSIWDKEKKRSTKSKAHWISIKIIPGLFTNVGGG